jgi:hypothetical protein
MNRIVDIKELKKVICAASALVAAVGNYSCSSTRQEQKAPDSRGLSWLGAVATSSQGNSLGIQKLWSRALDGYITELSLSQQGNAVLLSTLPDYDHENGAKKNLLRYFDGNGHQKWSAIMPTQVKSQAISRDGSLAIATTHEDQVMAFNSKGEKLWTAHATCMPFVIETRKEILCYHDDDAEPLVAFDVFDWGGKLKKSFPIKNDILALKVSKDEQTVAIALTQGNVLLLGPDYALKWSAKVAGEIVDLDVSNGADPKVAVLYSTGMGKSQKLTWLKGGKSQADGAPAGQVSQIAMTPDASSVFAYGNGGSGQYISMFQGPTQKSQEMQESWRHGVENNAHYTQTLFVSLLPFVSPTQFVPVTQAILGVEQVSAGSRQSEVVGIGSTGVPLWRLPVSISIGSEEGAFLYAQSWSASTAKLAISTDDRHFGLFQVISR